MCFPKSEGKNKPKSKNSSEVGILYSMKMELCCIALCPISSISTRYPISFLISSYYQKIPHNKNSGKLFNSYSNSIKEHPLEKELSLEMYSEKISNYCKKGCIDKAIVCISEMQALGLCPNVHCYSCLIEDLGSVDRTLEVEMLFQEMIFLGLRPSVRIFNFLFRGFLRKGLYELAIRGLKVMEELGICENQETFEIFLNYCASAGRLSDSWRIIADMRKKGFRLNSFVYSRVIELYRDNGMWKKAMEIVGEISEMGVGMDRRIYNNIIDTLGKYGELGEALDVYAKMRREGIVPDIVTWNSLIKWHCKAGEYMKPLDFFTEMQDQGLYPDPKIFIILIRQLGDQGKWDFVKRKF